MAVTYKPPTNTDLAEFVAQGGKFEIIGGGTKHGLGRPSQAETVLDMSAFKSISLYEPEELVLEAGAGTLLADIERALPKTTSNWRSSRPIIRNCWVPNTKEPLAA